MDGTRMLNENGMFCARPPTTVKLDMHFGRNQYKKVQLILLFYLFYLWLFASLLTIVTAAGGILLLH